MGKVCFIKIRMECDTPQQEQQVQDAVSTIAREARLQGGQLLYFYEKIKPNIPALTGLIRELSVSSNPEIVLAKNAGTLRKLFKKDKK